MRLKDRKAYRLHSKRSPVPGHIEPMALTHGKLFKDGQQTMGFPINNFPFLFLKGVLYFPK